MFRARRFVQLSQLFLAGCPGGRVSIITRNAGLSSKKLLVNFSTTTTLRIHSGQSNLALKLPQAKITMKKGGKKTSKTKVDDEKNEEKSHGISHGKLWFVEKAISASLVVVVPLAIRFPNPLFDLVLIAGLMPHIHWGVVATVIDYIRPIIVGDAMADLAAKACYGISLFIALGLLHLTLRGQGIGHSVQTLWSM